MKKFIIERNFPGASDLSTEELQAISQSFCEIANKLGNSYTWVQSFVTGDKMYCVHIAENEEVVREHSKLSQFPINIISEVTTVIDPITGNPVKTHALPKD